MKFYLKYNFPLFLFLILEKSSNIFWTSKTYSMNSYVCIINKNWFFSLNQVLKNEYFLSNSFLVENTAIDASFLDKFKNSLNYFSKYENHILLSYLYYFLFIKIKICFLLYSGLKKSLNSAFFSIDNIYKNANWVERETSEMYNVYFLNKNDTRKILLDYSKNEYPLLKNYPSEGYQDVFYNFFENQVSVLKNEVVEL